jgi:hypothetical protein
MLHNIGRLYGLAQGGRVPAEEGWGGGGQTWTEDSTIVHIFRIGSLCTAATAPCLTGLSSRNT